MAISSRFPGLSRFLKRPWPLRRALRWAGFGGLGFALLVLAGWQGVPPLVRHLAQQQIEQQLGRKATLGEVSFNPLTLTLIASDFTLHEADRSAVAFSAQTLLVNVSIASIFKLAPVLQQVTLSGPQLHVIRSRTESGGRYNFSDIIERIQAKPKSEGSAARFSVSNIELVDGSITFDDRVTGKQVAIADLNIGLPQVSNFASAVDMFVRPKLSMTVNGSPFELKGRSKPFTLSQETTLALDIDQLDVASYVGFSPVPLPVTVQSSKLSTRLDLNFVRKQGVSEITLSGDVNLMDVAITDNRAAPLFNARAISTHIDEFNVLTASAAIGSIDVQSPEVWAALDADGQLNWAALVPAQPASVAASKPASASAPINAAPIDSASTAAAGAKPPPPPAAPPRWLTLAQLTISDGTINWQDAANAKPAFKLQLKNVAASARQLSGAGDATPATVSMSAGAKDAQQIAFEGEFAPASSMLTGKASIAALPLAQYRPYVDRALAGNLSGQLALQTIVAVNQGKVLLTQLNAQVADAALAAKSGAKTADAGGVQIKKISLTDASVDIAARTFAAAAFKLAGMQADVRRDANGDINLAQFVAAPSAQPGSGSVKSANTSKASSKELPQWVATVGSVAVTDSSIAFIDASVAPDVRLHADALSLTLSDVSSQRDQPLSFALSGTLNKRGKLAIDGSAAPQWKSLDLAIDAQKLPVAALQPYFADLLNATLSTGGVDAKGKLKLSLPSQKQALAVRYNGTLGLSNFRFIDKQNSTDFLRWKSLDVSAIDISIDSARQDINLGKIALDDFYARAILSPEGVLNLQEVLVSSAGRKSVVPEAADTKVAAASESKPESKAVAVAAQTAKPDDSAAKQVIRIGQVLLKNSNVNFTDNFIKPNYTANMTGMNGSIGAFASDQQAPATIDLNGKIDDDAPVAISGSLNVLSQPIFLDIKISASDVELPQLTPYAAKYAGYAIVKGKLSMDANYKIEDKLLAAQNRVRIDQLTFGQRIDSPSATDLPVLLAVALLKDRNGLIDIDLPISGSLSDPKFSVGIILGRVFMNLLTQAVTSPFALLGSLFGDGEELGHAEFQPGSAALTMDTKSRLDKLVKALTDRPALKLNITGRIDPVSDEPGLRRENLQRKLHALQRKASASGSGAAAQKADIALTDAERARYLEQIYQEGTFDKPRNVLGFAKSLSAVKMEQMILANANVTQDDLRALANQRAQAVRKYLETNGKISLQRIFLNAPKLNADGIDDKGATNRVDFGLR
ncbi:MAG: hypothetical protein ACI83P_000593 [Janthinobacterium sp.]|jgi:hypothetical protein